jgi:hypothetical protein
MHMHRYPAWRRRWVDYELPTKTATITTTSTVETPTVVATTTTLVNRIVALMVTAVEVEVAVADRYRLRHQHHSCFEYQSQPNTGSLGAKKRGWRTYGAHVRTNNSWLRTTGSTGDDDCGFYNSCLPRPARTSKLLHDSMISFTKSCSLCSYQVYFLRNLGFHFPFYIHCSLLYHTSTFLPGYFQYISSY